MLGFQNENIAYTWKEIRKTFMDIVPLNIPSRVSKIIKEHVFKNNALLKVFLHIT